MMTFPMSPRFQEEKFSELPRYMVHPRSEFLGPPTGIWCVRIRSYESPNVGCIDRGHTHRGIIAVSKKEEGGRGSQVALSSRFRERFN